ncbi:MAG: hypothetical protein CBC48_14005 [bacterium TMED88]|nr:antitermination protein NusG [Deltaproteobacteria bacterium]OUV27758.1 MAG: hypothetical protein CBC48_14005 [bacterium TMED88]
MEILSMEGTYVLLRWVHVLAGITWIGMLYYFNFVQTPFFGTELGGTAKSAMTRGLVPNALWWFRWGAMFTFLSGFLILSAKWGHEGVPLWSGYMTLILTGALMGTLMFLNVWLVIWPAQQVVIANAETVAAGGDANPEAAGRAARAGLASRTNTLFSIPMLFFMVGAANFPSLTAGIGMGQANLALYWILALIVIFAVEINCLVGTGQGRHKPLATVSGTIHWGLLLTVLLYILMSIFL